MSRTPPFSGPLDFAAVRAAISIQHVLRLLKFTPTSSSSAYQRGSCPLHGPPRPGDRRFVANLRRDLFYCFSCKAGGTQLDLWSAHTQLSLYEAALDLCHRHGITPPRKSS